MSIMQWCSVIAGLVASVLWFWSSVIRLPKTIGVLYGVPVGPIQELGDAVKKQSTLNAAAAAFTSLSVLGQALAMMS